MAYTPNNWVKGDTITAAKMNHMESGISHAEEYVDRIEGAIDELEAGSLSAVGAAEGTMPVADGEGAWEWKLNPVAEEVRDLKSAYNYLDSVSVGKNLIGNEAGVLYPCYIPAGTPYVNVSTSDGSIIAPVPSTATLKLICYNQNKQAIDSGWTLPASVAYKDLNFSAYYSSTDVCYLSLNAENAVPLMVTVQNSAVGAVVPYIPFFDNTQNLNKRVSEIERTIPAYYKNHISGKAATINAIESDIQIGFVTDPHYATNAQNSPNLMAYLWKNCPMNFIVNNGDILNHADSKAEAVRQIASYNSLYDFAGQNYYSVIGNHEHNRPSSGDSESLQLSLQQVKLACYSKLRNIKFSEKTSYYFDDDISKCRYYFIGCDRSGLLYDEDTAWVIHSFLTIPDGYGVIVFSHSGLVYDANYSPTGVIGKLNRICDALLAVANNYNNYHSYIGVDEYLDFSSLNAVPIAVFSGHVHFDGYYQYENTERYNGYIYVIATTCDAYGTQVVGQVDRTGGTINEQAFDVISVNKSNRQIKMTRIGAGADRTFTYSDYEA